MQLLFLTLTAAISPLSTLRQAIITLAPLCAKSTAVSSPIPTLAPVMSTVFPFSEALDPHTRPLMYLLRRKYKVPQASAATRRKDNGSLIPRPFEGRRKGLVHTACACVSFFRKICRKRTGYFCQHVAKYPKKLGGLKIWGSFCT